MAQALQKPYDLETFPLFLGRHVLKPKGIESCQNGQSFEVILHIIIISLLFKACTHYDSSLNES